MSTETAVAMFRDLLVSAAASDPMDAASIELIGRFRDLVVEESARQNLTKLLEPLEFFEGHVLDCLELRKSGLVGSGLSMDLGSGAGVPGIIMAALGIGSWVLAESEGRKAEFLEHARLSLGLEQVEVFRGRAESFLDRRAVDSVVARAVGPVGRICAWIGNCSTWNNLVLLKGPAWDEEWAEYSRTSAGKRLEVTGQHDYAVGSEQKKRVIIRLSRKKSVVIR